MSEVEIQIRFVGTNNKFPSQKLKWILDMFELLKKQGKEIPQMEISVVDRFGTLYQTKIEYACNNQTSRNVHAK